MAIACIVLFKPFSAVSSQTQPIETDWTPVVVTTHTPKTEAILGTDGKYHLVYELELTNTIRIAATIEQIEVLNGNNPKEVIATYKDKDWSTRLRTLGNSAAPSAEIDTNNSRLLLIRLPAKIV